MQLRSKPQLLPRRPLIGAAVAAADVAGACTHTHTHCQRSADIMEAATRTVERERGGFPAG